MTKKFSEIPIQKAQNYWDARPCNFKHSAKTPGTKAYFDEVEKKKFFVEPHLVEFANFPSVKGKKILEIGCGLGTVAINFARAGAKKVTAVDLSGRSIALAKQHAEANALAGKIEFYQANAEELSKILPVEEYDLIFSFGVIHHTPHPEKVLKELQRFLNPNGQIKIMVYYRYAWKVFWILMKYGRFQFWNLSEHVAIHSEAQTGCPITYTYSKSQACELLGNQGFKPIDMQIGHIFPYRIREYVKNEYVKVWYFRFLPARLFQFFEKKFGWHLCITAVKE